MSTNTQTKILTIGQDTEIYAYYTKQKGYGRQALYVELKRNDIPFHRTKSFIKDVYVMDVFPNLLEHFQDSYYLSDYAIYDSEREVFTRDSGFGEYTADCIFNNTNELLNHALKGMEIEVEVEVEEDDEPTVYYAIYNHLSNCYWDDNDKRFYDASKFEPFAFESKEEAVEVMESLIKDLAESAELNNESLDEDDSRKNLEVREID